MTEPTLDRIHIRDLQVRCIIGLFEDERINKQDVVVNITLYADLSRAGQSDDINDTVDYKSIKKKLVSVIEASQFLLVEKLAQEIANICLEPEGVQRVDVCVDKPGALRYARSVAVEITRNRG